MDTRVHYCSVSCRQTLASVVELQMHGKHHYQVRPTFYTCCVCLKSFDSKENLVSKLNSSGRTYYVCKPCYHGESPLHTCSQCSEKFASKAQLDAHMATHNSPSSLAIVKSASAFSAPQTFQCIKCQESFSTEYEIQLHVANHMIQEGTSHECKLCTSIFESPAKLQCHLIEHTYKNEGEIRCKVCCKVFRSAAEIQVHALEHGSHGRRHTCGQCSQRFFFSAELDNHVLIYNHSPASVSTESSHRHFCHDCSKVFSSASALASHRKTHEHQETNLKCSLCTQTFANVISMQQHFLTTHMAGLDVGRVESGGGKNTHTCSQCKQQFATAESLQVHINSSHKSGKSELSCPVCNKTFTQTKLFTLHLRCHAESKPFPCHVCQKKFSREENLKAHLKSHAGLSPPLVCPLCNKSFTKRTDITEHLKTHFNTTEKEQTSSATPEATPDLSAAGTSENTASSTMNGNADLSNASSSSDSAEVSMSGVNGLHEEGSETAVELVIPNPQLNRPNKCKTN